MQFGNPTMELERQYCQWRQTLIIEIKGKSQENAQDRLKKVELMVNDTVSKGLAHSSVDIYMPFVVKEGAFQSMNASINKQIEDWKGVEIANCRGKEKKTFTEYQQTSRNWFNRNKAKIYGNHLFCPLMFELVLDYCCALPVITDACKMIIFINILNAVLCESIQFPKTKLQPLLPHQSLMQPNRFKKTCHAFAKHYCKDWPLMNSSANDQKKDKCRAKKIHQSFTECLSNIKSALEDSSLDSNIAILFDAPHKSTLHVSLLDMDSRSGDSSRSKESESTFYTENNNNNNNNNNNHNDNEVVLDDRDAFFEVANDSMNNTYFVNDNICHSREYEFHEMPVDHDRPPSPLQPLHRFDDSNNNHNNHNDHNGNDLLRPQSSFSNPFIRNNDMDATDEYCTCQSCCGACVDCGTNNNMHRFDNVYNHYNTLVQNNNNNNHSTSYSYPSYGPCRGASTSVESYRASPLPQPRTYIPPQPRTNTMSMHMSPSGSCHLPSQYQTVPNVNYYSRTSIDDCNRTNYNDHDNSYNTNSQSCFDNWNNFDDQMTMTVDNNYVHNNNNNNNNGMGTQTDYFVNDRFRYSPPIEQKFL